MNAKNFSFLRMDPRVFFVHLLMAVLFSFVYEGVFLIAWYPLFLWWIFLSFFFSVCSRVFFRILERELERGFFLVWIWVLPIGYMTFLLGFSLFLLWFCDFFGYPDFLRQILQLDLSSFSSFLYINWILVFFSGTWFFMDACLSFFMRMNFFSVHKNVKKINRFSILLLLILLCFGSFFLYHFRPSTLLYFYAVFMERGGRSQEALEIYQKIAKSSQSIRANAMYRSGRILFLRYHQFAQARNYFHKVLEDSSFGLLDGALWQILLCMREEGELADQVEKTYKKHRISHSSLNDEMEFLIAGMFFSQKNYQKACEMYESLQKSPFWRGTILMDSTFYQKSWTETAKMAQLKKEECLLRPHTFEQAEP